jgi:hypothetical protein
MVATIVLNFIRRNDKHEQDKKSSVAQTPGKSQETGRETPGPKGQWHSYTIDSAAIIAALPYFM